MTATMNRNHSPLLFVSLALLLLLIVVISVIQTMPLPPTVIGSNRIAVLEAPAANGVAVNNGEHAISKHLADADMIHKCLDDSGPHQVWKSSSWKRPRQYFQVCQLDDGRWGFRLIEKTRAGWRELTSFVPKDGTWGQLVEYLSARASVWGGWLSAVR